MMGLSLIHKAGEHRTGVQLAHRNQLRRSHGPHQGQQRVAAGAEDGGVQAAVQHPPHQPAQLRGDPPAQVLCGQSTLPGVAVRVITAGGIVDVQNEPPLPPRGVQPRRRGRRTRLRLQPGLLQLLGRAEMNVGKAVGLRRRHLAQRHRVYAAAGHKQGGGQIWQPGRRAPQIQNLRQGRRKARAAGGEPQPLPAQPQADVHQVPVGLRVVDLDAGADCRRLPQVVEHHRPVRLGGDDLRHGGTSHRLKGVLAKDALRYRHTANVVNAAPGNPVHFRQGRHKGQTLRPGALQHRGQLRAHIAPQGGVRLLVNMGEPRGQGFLHRPAHHAAGRLRRQVAGLGVQHQHLNFRPRPGEVIGRVRHHAGPGSPGGELHARIQRSCEIIRNDQ